MEIHRPRQAGQTYFHLHPIPLDLTPNLTSEFAQQYEPMEGSLHVFFNRDLKNWPIVLKIFGDWN